jgi:hypothetical protein
MKTTEIKPTLTQTQVEASTINTPQIQLNSPADLVVPIALNVMATCAIALFLGKGAFKKGSGTTFLKTPLKIPCQNCFYFSKNSLLKCAVHPTTAMTTEAVGCSDFCDSRKKP